MAMNPAQMEMAIREIWIEITALHSALDHSGKITDQEMKTFRVTAEPIVMQKMMKLIDRTSSGKP